jgi:hypothetical protein
VCDPMRRTNERERGGGEIAIITGGVGEEPISATTKKFNFRLMNPKYPWVGLSWTISLLAMWPACVVLSLLI